MSDCFYQVDLNSNITWPYIPAAPAVPPTYTLTWPQYDPRVDELLERVSKLEAEVERLKRRRKKAAPSGP